MACRDMRDLMCHDAGKLRFVLSCNEKSTSYVQKSTRESQSIDFFGVDHLNRKRHLGIGVAHQSLSNAVYVFRYEGIVQRLGKAFNLVRILPADLCLSSQRIPVAETGASDVSHAYGIQVINASGMFCPFRRRDIRNGWAGVLGNG